MGFKNFRSTYQIKQNK